jgi:hypothetical protein
VFHTLTLLPLSTTTSTSSSHTHSSGFMQLCTLSWDTMNNPPDAPNQQHAPSTTSSTTPSTGPATTFWKAAMNDWYATQGGFEANKGLPVINGNAATMDIRDPNATILDILPPNLLPTDTCAPRIHLLLSTALLPFLAYQTHSSVCTTFSLCRASHTFSRFSNSPPHLQSPTVP